MYDVLKLRERFVSEEWNVGVNKDFAWEAEERFSWGSLHMRLDVREGVIKGAEIFSDAMDAECIAAIHSLLTGKAFTSAAMREAVRGIGTYAEDICDFIEKYT
jgi:lipoate-protein ligase A